MFKHEVLNASAKGGLEECEIEVLNSLMVCGKDATRGLYQKYSTGP